MISFDLAVEEDLEFEEANEILVELEEVLGKHGLSLDHANWETM